MKDTIPGRSQVDLLTHERWYPIMNFDPGALLGCAAWGVGETLSKDVHGCKKTKAGGRSCQANLQREALNDIYLFV